MLPHKTRLLFVQAFYRLLCSSVEKGSATECVMCPCCLLSLVSLQKRWKEERYPQAGYFSHPTQSSLQHGGCLQALICDVLLLCLFSEYATLAAICRPSPSLFLYSVSLSASLEGCTRPLPLLPLPAEDAHSENIVYWLLCQNKKPH